MPPLNSTSVPIEMDSHFPKRALKSGLSDCIPGAGFSLQQKPVSSSNPFRFPSPIGMHLCVCAGQLAAPSSFPGDSPLRSTGPGLHRGRFPSVGKTEVGGRGKEKGLPHWRLSPWKAPARRCLLFSRRDPPHGRCGALPAPAAGAVCPAPGRGGPAAGRGAPAVPTTAAVGTRVAGQKGEVSGARGAGGVPGCPSHLGSPHSPLFLCISPPPKRTAGAPYRRAPPRARSRAALLGTSIPSTPPEAPPRVGSGAAGRVFRGTPRQRARRSAGARNLRGERCWGPGRAAAGLGGTRAAVTAAING